MKIADRIMGPLLALFGLCIIWRAHHLPSIPGARFGPDLLPTIIGITLILFGGILFAHSARETTPLINLSEWQVTTRNKLAAIWALGGLLAGTFLFEPLGFVLFGTLFMAGLMALMEARLPTIIVIAPLFTLALYLTFAGLLRVELPAGPLAGILP